MRPLRNARLACRSPKTKASEWRSLSSTISTYHQRRQWRQYKSSSNPLRGAVLLYPGPPYDSAIRFTGPSSTRMVQCVATAARSHRRRADPARRCRRTTSPNEPGSPHEPRGRAQRGLLARCGGYPRVSPQRVADAPRLTRATSPNTPGGSRGSPPAQPSCRAR
jgi:hypothetical protein